MTISYLYPQACSLYSHSSPLASLAPYPLVSARLEFIVYLLIPAGRLDVNARDIGIEARAIPDLSLDFAQWIWTGEEGSPGGGAPVGWRGFRKNISHIQTGCPVCVTFAIASYVVSLRSALYWY